MFKSIRFQSEFNYRPHLTVAMTLEALKATKKNGITTAKKAKAWLKKNYPELNKKYTLSLHLIFGDRIYYLENKYVIERVGWGVYKIV